MQAEQVIIPSRHHFKYSAFTIFFCIQNVDSLDLETSTITFFHCFVHIGTNDHYVRRNDLHCEHKRFLKQSGFADEESSDRSYSLQHKKGTVHPDLLKRGACQSGKSHQRPSLEEQVRVTGTLVSHEGFYFVYLCGMSMRSMQTANSRFKFYDALILSIISTI